MICSRPKILNTKPKLDLEYSLMVEEQNYVSIYRIQRLKSELIYWRSNIKVNP